MHFYCLQFLIVIFAIVYSRSDESLSTKTNKADDSLSSPVVWVLVEQIDRLESKVEKLYKQNSKKNEELRNDFSKDIKNLQTEVQQIRKTETFIGFHVKLSANTRLASSERVVFDYVIYNNGEAYDRYTGIFKAPYDGEYFFISSFLSHANVGDLHLQMFKNDDEISRGYGSSPGSNTGTMTAVVHLKAGDRVYVRHITSSNQTIHGGWSYFTGFLLRRTN